MTYVSQDDLIEFCLSDFALKENIVYWIDDCGRDHLAKSPHEVIEALANCHTLKIQSMEKYDAHIFAQCLKLSIQENRPVTAHAYVSLPESSSFSEHVDDHDVMIHCLDGCKTMVVDGKNVEIHKNNTLAIPAGTPHYATNRYQSFIISYGIEDFMKNRV